jgi:hypothetical protein
MFVTLVRNFFHFYNSTDNNLHNDVSAHTCCIVAMSIIHLPRITCIKLDYSPAECIRCQAWHHLDFGFPVLDDVLPLIFDWSWVDALDHLRFRIYSRLVRISRNRIDSSLCRRIPGVQLPAYTVLTAITAVRAFYFPILTHAQLRLLLCMGGHACYFIHVMMHRDVRRKEDPRKELALRLCTGAIVQRLCNL